MSDVTMADCRVIFHFDLVDSHTGDHLGRPEGHRPLTSADLDSLIRERGVTDEMVDRAIEAWESAPEYQTVVTTVREMLLAALTGEEEAQPKKCICPKFRDTGGFRIGDLACLIHGVGGTEPLDGPWDTGEEEE